MRTKTSIIALTKAFFILLVSGWRSVQIFGTPNSIMDRYIVILKNGAVMEFNYSNIDGNIKWWKIGVGDESKENPVEFWKPFPKPFFACH